MRYDCLWGVIKDNAEAITTIAAVIAARELTLCERGDHLPAEALCAEAGNPAGIQDCFGPP